MEAFLTLIGILCLIGFIVAIVVMIIGNIGSKFYTGSSSIEDLNRMEDARKSENAMKRQAEYTAKAIKNGGELGVGDEIMTNIKFHD